MYQFTPSAKTVKSNTGHRWVFPRDLRKYIGLAHAQDSLRGGCACESGHFGCAAWDGGPCSDEMLAEYEAEASAFLWKANPYFRVISRRDDEAARDYAERLGAGESLCKIDAEMVADVMAVVS